MREFSIIALMIPGYALYSCSGDNSRFKKGQTNSPVGNSATPVITTEYKKQVFNNGYFTEYSNVQITNR